ncbi:MAG: DUF4124 domain-containing protein [Kangiellaceae bacterium]|nr:DUF4124 domain-containing protein [Kangiellaceae bacterium]
MAMIKTVIFSVMIALMSTSVIAGQTIYKWKDAKGNLKYTQTKPPAGTAYVTIKNRDSRASSSPAPQASEQAASATSKQDEIIAQQEAEKKRVNSANQEINRKNCTIAKNNLEVLETRSRVQVEENGERRMLSDEERAERLTKAKENVSKFCEQ